MSSSTLSQFLTGNFSGNSLINKCLSPSSSSSDEVTFIHNRKLVLELIDGIFDDEKGGIEISSSNCSSKKSSSSEYSFDKPLKNWKGMLEDRKQISAAIQQITGKQRADVLFNQPTTIDDRDKQMMKRVMDYGERMVPCTLLNRKQSKLPEYTDKNCRLVRELQETLPLAEQTHEKTVEIIGIPAVIKDELIGIRSDGVSPWLKSKVLQERVEERHEDIERIIPFYPDIENLQIVGESVFEKTIKSDTIIKLQRLDSTELISSDSSLHTAKNNKVQIASNSASVVEPAEYGMRINGIEWTTLKGKHSTRNMIVNTQFYCEPFQKVTKCVMRVENIGSKLLHCQLYRRCFYDDKSVSLFYSNNVFIINKKSFQLLAGETFDVIVQFRPCCVNIWKEKWLLKIEPQFFCCKSYSIIFKLIGHCKPGILYTRRLDGIQRLVIEKSNLEAMRNLTVKIVATTLMIKPAEILCPYKRTLYERELFEIYNTGYKCERYHDLELLKGLYKRIKKPREPEWDLRLETLQETVMHLESAERRALVFSEMMGILTEMRGTPVDLESDVRDNTERDRSRLIYVRGSIAKCIDEWEEITNNVQEVFIQPLIDKYYKINEEEIEQEEEEQEEEQTMPNDFDRGHEDEKEAVKSIIFKKMRRLKVFRDTLYIYTYNHLCDCVEDIVSIIESTEIM